jgi:ethanolamine-phosphate cytidylyltransferase
MLCSVHLQRGDYLIVGVHSDTVVNRLRGKNFPLFNMKERVLSVLGCRFVDDVLMDAPYNITLEMIATLGIKEVIHGMGYEDLGYCLESDERYQEAKANGIFHVLRSPSSYCMTNVFDRIRTDHETFQVRFEKKTKAETEHFSQKYVGDSQGSDIIQ